MTTAVCTTKLQHRKHRQDYRSWKFPESLLKTLAVRTKPITTLPPPASGGHAEQNHLVHSDPSLPWTSTPATPSSMWHTTLVPVSNCQDGSEGFKAFQSTKRKNESFQHHSTQKYPNPLFFPRIFLSDMSNFTEMQHFQYKLKGKQFLFSPQNRMFGFIVHFSLLCALILPLPRP